MSTHELLLEIRADMKLVLQKIPTFVTWAKLGTAVVAVATLITAVVALA